MSQSLNSFLMDEQLEPLSPDEAGTTLNILKPHADGSDIELRDDVHLAAPLSESEVVAIEAALIDLGDVGEAIRSSGMSKSIALEMDRISGDSFLNEEIKLGMFTEMPTKVGVQTGLEALVSLGGALIDKLAEKFQQFWQACKEAGAKLMEKLREYRDRYSYLFSSKTREFEFGYSALVEAVCDYYAKKGEGSKAVWLKANRKMHIASVLEHRTFVDLIESDDARAVASNFRDFTDNTIRRARLIVHDRETFASLEKIEALNKSSENMLARDVISDNPERALKFFASNVATYGLDFNEFNNSLDKIQTRFNKENAQVTNITSVPSYRDSVRYLELVFRTIKDMQAVNSIYMKIGAFIMTHLQCTQGKPVEETPAFKNLVRFVENNASIVK